MTKIEKMEDSYDFNGFIMDTYQTDWLLVIIAALLNVGISAAWYSKWLFGPNWLKLTKVKETAISKMAFIWSFVISLIIAYCISFFEIHIGITNVTDGMLLGFLIWLGFVATTEITQVIWGLKPFKLFVINSGCKILSFLVMSGIIAA